MDFTPHQLAQRIVELGLVEPLAMERVWSDVGLGDVDTEDLISALLRS